ncbi:hypothetical protein C8Q79DRAFT_265256 [Trametes meyenii]|nr:hypothetical protein C8Q79DRAFT_265256 [Trametes meyenii]
MSETSATLDGLLSFCHPLAPEHTFPTFDMLAPVLHAWRKYDLRGGAHSRAMCALAPCLRRRPIQVYAFAVRSSMPGLARLAARACLRLTASFPDDDEFRNLDAQAYRALLVFRDECARSFSALASMDDVGRDAIFGQRWVWVDCAVCRRRAHRRGDVPWFERFYRELVQSLTGVVEPGEDEDEREEIIAEAAQRAMVCAGCGKYAHNELSHYASLCAAEVERRFEEATRLLPLQE